jgi:hypothetical protein
VVILPSTPKVGSRSPGRPSAHSTRLNVIRTATTLPRPHTCINAATIPGLPTFSCMMTGTAAALLIALPLSLHSLFLTMTTHHLGSSPGRSCLAQRDGCEGSRARLPVLNLLILHDGSGRPSLSRMLLREISLRDEAPPG